MATELMGVPAFRKDSKEYLMFCRIRGLFLVDGLEHWRTALQAKGHSDKEIASKVQAASHFVRRIGAY